jgi:putative membrane protein
MTNLLITWAVLALSMALAAKLLSRMKIRGGVGSHLLVSALFGLLMALVGWLVYAALGMLSLGLLFAFSFLGKLLAGAVVLKITDAFSDRLEIEGFGTAILASLVISVSGTVAEIVLRSLAH